MQITTGLAQVLFLWKRAWTDMRARKTLSRPGLSSALIVALVAGMLQAQGTWSLGRSLAEVTAADREAMARARGEVLDNLKPGAVSAWKDEKTGHLGKAHLLRVYEKNGMTCGDVEQILKVQQASHYVISFCRASDGTWRAAL
jgi:surface antigen